MTTATNADETNQAETLRKTFLALKKTQARVQELENQKTQPIAVVGMACRLPGGANDPELLWSLLERGLDACRDIPAERWPGERFYHPSADAPGMTHAARANFLDVAVDEFDAPFFGISAKEAQSLDPQQRMLLEVAWDALEDAGIDPASLRGSQTGVFVGISSDDYAQAHRHSGRLDLIDGYALTGTCFAPAAGRLSYTLGLEGPSMAVDTACSSSLVAMHLACQSLRDGESDVALTGGVNLILSPIFHIASSKLGTISPDGRCKTFDSSADGYGRGEGCGVVVLKRLADAQAQGDRILAVVRATAVNQDGKSNGLTAPNGLAQEKVIRQALGRANLSPADIGYVEVHGTGTQLGDPIEVEAIGRVMQGARPDGDRVILSSVKTNIGHLEAAAGISGFIKAVESLRHDAIPPHPSLRDPSPHIPWNDYPFRVVTELTPWPKGDRPRHAGVSSFGFSGTNAHVILGDAPVAPPRQPHAPRSEVLPLSARTPEALAELVHDWADWLDRHDGPDDLADACLTAGAGRSHFNHRLAVVGANAKEISEALRAHLAGQTRRTLAVGAGGGARPRLAFLFTGQGSQYVGMGRDLYATQPVFRAVLDQCDQAFQAPLGRSLIQLMHAGDDAELTRTGFAQPAIFAIQMGLVALWRSWGVDPDMVCGHSIGEYAAACVAGVLSLEDGARLVAERGRLMQSLPEGGAMAAIFTDEASLRAHLEQTGLSARGDIAVAAVNTLAETVVSGSAQSVADLLAVLDKKGVMAQPLRVSHAFHSPLMRPIVAKFRDFAADMRFGAPTLSVVSSVTGKRLGDGDFVTPGYWAGQIEAPVRFAQAVQTMAAEGATLFLEIGPSTILTGLARQTLADRSAEGDLTFATSLQRPGGDDRKTLIQAVAQLYAAGANADWAALSSGVDARKTSVPGYPFQRKSYYLPPIVDAAAGTASETGDAHPTLGRRVVSPALPQGTDLYQAVFTADLPAFLKDHQIFGKIISPAAAHLSMALSASRGRGMLEDVAFTAPLVVEPGVPRVVQLVIEGQNPRTYRLLSRDSGEENGAWISHSTGQWAAPRADQPVRADLDALRGKCPGTMTTQAFYETIEALGYVTGPSFQCIRDIHKGDNESVCRIEAAQKIDDQAIHPGLIDCLLQTVLPACETSAAHMLTGQTVLIPLHMGFIRVLGSLDQPLVTHTRVEVKTDLVKSDITAYGLDGTPLLEIRDFLLKQTDRATLYQDMRQDDRGLIHLLDWRPHALPSVPPTLDPAVGWVVAQGGASDGGNWADGLVGDLAANHAGPVALTADFLDPANLSTLRDRLVAIAANPGVTRINLLFADRGGSSDPSVDCPLAATHLLTLVQALGVLDGREKFRLWIITRAAQQAVRDDRARLSPFGEGAALWGMGRAIATEFPEFWGGMVDLEPVPGQAAFASLRAVIAQGSGEDHLAIRRGNQVLAERLLPLPRGGQQSGDGHRRLPKVTESEGYFLDKGARRTLDDLTFKTRPRHAPAAGEIEVSILASGLNFRDVLNALGQYPGEAGLLGFEAVGVVSALGDGVTDLVLGDTVIVMAAPGCIASHVTVSRSLVVKKPKAMTVAQAVTLPATFLTAHYALNYLGKMVAGDRVLIHAAAGGVGLAAVQLAQAAGAEVFATVGSPEKRAHLEAMGVRHIFNSRNTDFAEQIREATGGKGVTMVLNSLNGDFINASFSILADGGRFLEMGKIGIWDEDKVMSVNPSWFYRPFDLAAVVKEDEALITGMFGHLMDELQSGRLTPLPQAIFTMNEAEDSFRFMAQARHIGKVVLTREDDCRRELIQANGLVRGDGAYLITGGLGALGLLMARWLVDDGARALILTSRRAPSAAVEAQLDQLRADGVTITVSLGDVSRPEDVGRILASASHPVRGIIHAAGLLEDGMMADLDEGKISRVMAPKVTGAWALHQASLGLDLDFFVLFSSVAAIIGNLGQGNYAAANAFMDGLAHHRRKLGLPATSINWGPWAEAGMAAALETDHFAAQGIRALNPAQGVRVLKYVLAEVIGQAVVSDMDWAAYGQSHGMDGKTGLFAAVLAGAGAGQAESAQVVTRDIVAELRAVLPGERGDVLRDYLQSLARQTLGYGEQDVVSLDQPLVEQGFDSLMSVDMRNRLNKSLGRALPASLLFDYPTLEKIARYLLDKVITFDDAPAGADAKDKAAAKPAQATDALLDEINSLIGGR